MRMFARILALLLLFTALSASASLLSQQGVPARYMQTTEDADIWAQVGNQVVSVGNVRAGQILAVVPTAADYYEFNFGFATGFIDKGHLGPVQGKQRVEDSLGDLHKPLSNKTSLPGKIRQSMMPPPWAARHLAPWRIICVIRLSANSKIGLIKPGFRFVSATAWRG
jgi:hypothetical protein